MTRTDTRERSEQHADVSVFARRQQVEAVLQAMPGVGGSPSTAPVPSREI